MSGDHAEVLVDGHVILPRLLADLRAARRDIHVSVFLFFRDPIGEEVASILADKARSGVDVRVLLNLEKTAMGDPFSTGEKQMMRHDPAVKRDPLDVRPMCEALRQAGARVIDSDIDYDAVVAVHDPRLQSIAAQIRGAIDVDALHIDHRKIVVIDGCIAYCGGANIGAQYLYHHAFDPARHARQEAETWLAAGHPEPWWKWHDSLTRFVGPVVPAIEDEFRTRWILDGGDAYDPPDPLPPPSPPTGAPLAAARVFTNAPDDQPNAICELYLRLIASAERSIFIENPYLYHPTLVEALCVAKRARPHLHVVLVLPDGDHNDNAFGQDAQEHHYADYLACGIEVYQYQNHFNHLKIAVFDDRWSIHGSTNLNFRSLEPDRDFELVVLVDSEPLARWVCAHVRDVDIGRSRRIVADDVEGHSLHALRTRVRDPRTLLLISRRLL